MAVQVRTRRLSNPSKRLVRRKNASTKKKRKLSPKQIAIFGTPRQKAALRASRSRKRLSNGSRSLKRLHKRNLKGYASDASLNHKAKTSRIRKEKRRKNVGEIVSISLAGLTGNPGKRRNTGMAKRRKRLSKSPSARAARRRYRATHRVSNPVHRRRTHTVARRRRRRTNTGVARRRNPVYRVRRVGRRNSGRRNPGMMSGLTTGLLGKAVGLIGGMLGARYLTQLVLGGNNTGYVGYAGNVAASVILGMVAGKATKSKDLGNMVMIGGIASTILRVVSEKTSYGSFIQTSLSGAGKGGDVGIGIITDSSFFNPQVAQPGSMTSFITPAATRSYVGSQIAQTASMAAAGSPGKAGMGMLRGRRARAVV